MRIAFRTGGVAGMFTVGLGLLGASIVVLIYKGEAPKVLEGFGFGAALLAMFMRVGGGIFTKAADVGADLVGKVEQGIPEDDPRNAATIADNVGDNVGDCAGMAADLFESYAVTLVAALILGKVAFGELGLVFPLIVPAIGVLTAVIGIFAVSPRPSDRSGMSAINRGFFISAVISAVLVAIAAFVFLPERITQFKGVVVEDLGIIGAVDSFNPRIMAIGAVIIGIVLAAAIQQLTGYFTETNRRPVDDVAKSSLTGPATVILAGISLGLESAVYSALLIGAAVYGAFLLGAGSITLSLFAIALAGTGLLTTVGVIVAMDTFGPVSDNAQGIAEMSGDVEGDGARCSPASTPWGTPRRRSPRASRSPRPCSQPRPCTGRSATPSSRPPRRPPTPSRACRSRTRCSTPASWTSPTRGTWSDCSSAQPWCSCSPASRSTRCRGRRARSSSRSVASSATTPGSWRGPRSRRTARSSTS